MKNNSRREGIADFFYNIRYELLTAISLLASVASFVVYRMYYYDRTARGVCFMVMVAGLVGFCVFFKRLFVHKLGRLISYAMNNIMEALRKLVGKAGKKLGIKRRKLLFGGSDSVEYFYGDTRIRGRKGGKKEKLPKWDDLPDNKSRARYIYAKYLQKRAKRGWTFRASDTPNRIAAEIAETPVRKQIFVCYNIARYSDDFSYITDDRIDELVKTEKQA